LSPDPLSPKLGENHLDRRSRWQSVLLIRFERVQMRFARLDVGFEAYCPAHKHAILQIACYSITFGLLFAYFNIT
jgi:hypothetical protein